MPENIEMQKVTVDDGHGRTSNVRQLLADKEVDKAPEEQKDDHGGYIRIFKFAGSTEYAILAVAFFAAAASGAGIAMQNLIFGRFITVLTDFTSGGESSGRLRSEASELALYFVYLGIGRFVLSYAYNTLLSYNAYRIVRNIRLAYLKAALSQDISYFDSGVSGSIATHATANGRLIEGGISEKLGLTFQGLSAFITAFAIAISANWKLTLITFCIAPVTLVVMGVTSGMEAGIETKLLTIYGHANAFAEGILSSARTVHAFDMRSRLVRKFDDFLVEAHQVGNTISPLFGILFSSEYCIIYLGFGLAFWQGIHMFDRGEIKSSGEIFTVLLSVITASVSLTSMAPYSIDFTRAAAAAGQLFVLIDRKSAIDPFDDSGERPSEIMGHVEFIGVSFAYPSRPGVQVLDDFSLDVPAGKVTALVGQSGSGKSTIIGLLERWYDPVSGAIKLDGQPIESLNLNWLRKNIRLVQQEPVLFQGSVFDNIAQGLIGTPWETASRDVQLAKVQDASRVAFAHEFISGLPQGYDTKIGQRGGLLSGGQKQRIAIARSVVSEPKMLLLDEATSALDPHTEQVVQQALDQASQGRTTIVIAHKLATIQKADNIVVMKKGRIVEQGTHESLISQDGAYAKLVRVQNLTLNSAYTKSDGDDEAASQGKVDAAPLTSTNSRIATDGLSHMKIQNEYGDYKLNKPLGFFAVVWRLVKQTPELQWTYLICLVGCVGASATFPGQALLIANIAEAFSLPSSDMVDRGNFYAAMFIVLAAGSFVSYFLIGYTTNLIAQTFSHMFRRQSLNDTLRQDLQFFDREENNTGALASQLDSHPQAILELMGSNIALIVNASLNIIFCSILGIVYSWKLGLVVVFAGLPPFLTSGWLKIRFGVKLDNKISTQNSASAAIASEAVNAIRTISSLAIERLVIDRYLLELDHAVASSLKPLLGMMLWFALTQSIQYWFMALGFWYGCYLVSNGETSVFDFFVTFMGVFFSAQATSQLFQFSSSIAKGQNAANYLFWLHELQPSVQETKINSDRGPRSGSSIGFDNVRFSYPLRPKTPILRDVSLQIKKGQFAAFVGASGCGKSTMIAMLERFYDPSTGNIHIDGDDLTSLNPRLYRSIVSLVQQEPALFQGTIRENIALGMVNPTLDANCPPKSPTVVSTAPIDKDIEAALRAANAWDFVLSLPDGLSTLTGSNGTQLSGGQRQRIAIARALIRNPNILLLDEATSALDTETEKLLQGTLADAARTGDRITIAVAHRLSTVKDADIIYVFYGGKIVEKGTHTELLAKDGIYKKMCEAQSLD